MKFTRRNCDISSSAQIGKNVRFGDNVVVYENVVIGDNSAICNNCVIGEPLRDYYSDPDYENPQTIIGEEAVVRSHAIIYAGNKIGNGFVSGHRILIRESNIIGDNTSIGSCAELHGSATIGQHCRLHSNTCVCEESTIGNYVFLFPGCILTNTWTPPAYEFHAPAVGDYTVIAVNAVILPVKIGNNCLVGAASVVTKDVKDFTAVVGNPAKVICDVRSINSHADLGPPYPWPHRFDAGMPWKGIGYEKWLQSLKNSQPG